MNSEFKIYWFLSALSLIVSCSSQDDEYALAYLEKDLKSSVKLLSLVEETKGVDSMYQTEIKKMLLQIQSGNSSISSNIENLYDSVKVSYEYLIGDNLIYFDSLVVRLNTANSIAEKCFISSEFIDLFNKLFSYPRQINNCAKLGWISTDGVFLNDGVYYSVPFVLFEDCDDRSYTTMHNGILGLGYADSLVVKEGQNRVPVSISMVNVYRDRSLQYIDTFNIKRTSENMH